LLINYKSDSNYIGSDWFYKTLVLRFWLTLICLCIGFIFVDTSEYVAFWPFQIALFIASQFLFDGILYVEDEKEKFILLRLSSQIFSLIFIFIVYNNIIAAYY